MASGRLHVTLNESTTKNLMALAEKMGIHRFDGALEHLLLVGARELIERFITHPSADFDNTPEGQRLISSVKSIANKPANSAV